MWTILWSIGGRGRRKRERREEIHKPQREEVNEDQDVNFRGSNCLGKFSCGTLSAEGHYLLVDQLTS